MAVIACTTHRFRRPILPWVIIAVFALGALGSAAAADGYVFPSTNAENALAGLPHVTEVAAGPGSVTLEFVNGTNSLAFFEYRIDGVVQPGGPPHPVVTGDVIYPGVCVDSRTSGPAEDCSVGSIARTLRAGETVEVRLALGGERDWDFDWTPFAVAPITKDSCKNGGWADLGFANQGRCIRFVKG